MHLASAHPLRRLADGAALPVLPDCCNFGIVLRVAVAVTAAFALAVLLVAHTGDAWLDRLLEGAALLEPVLFASLGLLCLVRPAIAGRSKRLQWFVGIAIPAAVMGIGATVAVMVTPVPPDEPWAWILGRTLAAIAVAAAAIEYFLLRARAFSPSLSEARLQALQARIRPHFLFNSLNTVLGLLRSDPRLAESTLEDLSELFRVFMRDTRELVPLAVEIETCRQYLAIERLRLRPRLEIDWRIDDLPPDALVPSLLVQPLVENAVHHGIEPRTEPGTVEVSVTRQAERIRIEIVNPVSGDAGGPVRTGNQMALSNVRERLMLLYDMEAELKVGADGDHFRLTLEFPYRRERRRRDE